MILYLICWWFLNATVKFQCFVLSREPRHCCQQSVDPSNGSSSARGRAPLRGARYDPNAPTPIPRLRRSFIVIGVFESWIVVATGSHLMSFVSGGGRWNCAPPPSPSSPTRPTGIFAVSWGRGRASGGSVARVRGFRGVGGCPWRPRRSAMPTAGGGLR